MIRVQVGDKVRLKQEPHRGMRAHVERVCGDNVMVRVLGSQEAVEVTPTNITNLSLAARKAWISMPKRSVGRPEGVKLCDRVSVTLRIDRDLWEEFQSMETSGIIWDRTNTINGWLRKNLAQLKTTDAKTNH
jgi:uncharacterized protein (DUF4415 family)